MSRDAIIAIDIAFIESECANQEHDLQRAEYANNIYRQAELHGFKKSVQYLQSDDRCTQLLGRLLQWASNTPKENWCFCNHTNQIIADPKDHWGGCPNQYKAKEEKEALEKETKACFQLMLADEQNEMEVDANKDAAHQFKLLARDDVLKCLTDNEIKSIIKALVNETTSRRQPPGRVINVKLMMQIDYPDQEPHSQSS